MIDKDKNDNIMAKQASKQDSSNRLIESNKDMSGFSEGICHQWNCTGIESKRLQRPAQDNVQIICCKLNKMPEGKLTSMSNATICDIGTKVASTVTSRYHKGIGGHKDNMVLEIWKKHLT